MIIHRFKYSDAGSMLKCHVAPWNYFATNTNCRSARCSFDNLQSLQLAHFTICSFYNLLIEKTSYTIQFSLFK